MVSIGPYTVTMRECQGDYDGPFSTYPEWHAFLWGVGYMATLVMALQIDEVAAAPVAAQIVRVSYFSMTGKRLTVAGKTMGILPDRYLNQIRRESHYWYGGLSACFGVAYLADWTGFVNLVFPLEELRPEVVGELVETVASLRPGTGA